MTPMTTQGTQRNMSLNYAERQRQKRQMAAARLAERVTRPVLRQTEAPRRNSTPAWIGAGGFLFFSLLLHSGLTGVLSEFESDTPQKPAVEKVVFQVVEPEPEAKTPPIAEPDPEPEAMMETEIPEPVIPQREVKPRRERAAKADPVNSEAPEPEPAPARRAVVGIEMSSTVTGGAGPAYAVGNTRMGNTAAVQSDEKAEKLTRGTRAGAGGADGAAAVNQKAAFIPTVSSDFTRPKRLQSVELPYPPELKSKGIEGNVMVLIVIDEQGAVQKVRILKSSGYREFDEAALKAARKELYTPALRDGKAVEYNLKYTYRFRMKGA